MITLLSHFYIERKIEEIYYICKKIERDRFNLQISKVTPPKKQI